MAYLLPLTDSFGFNFSFLILSNIRPRKKKKAAIVVEYAHHLSNKEIADFKDYKDV